MGAAAGKVWALLRPRPQSSQACPADRCAGFCSAAEGLPLPLPPLWASAPAGPRDSKQCSFTCAEALTGPGAVLHRSHRAYITEQASPLSSASDPRDGGMGRVDAWAPVAGLGLSPEAPLEALGQRCSPPDSMACTWGQGLTDDLILFLQETRWSQPRSLGPQAPDLPRPWRPVPCQSKSGFSAEGSV